MLLDKKQIIFILKSISDKTVVEPSQEFPYRVSIPCKSGYSSDPDISKLQATLSIMLEMASESNKI